jgi:flagellar hook-length control protein FliK
MTPIISTILSTISNALSPSASSVKDIGTSFGEVLSETIKSKSPNTSSNSAKDAALPRNETSQKEKGVTQQGASTTTQISTNLSDHQDSTKSTDESNLINAQIVLSMLSQNSTTTMLQNATTSAQTNQHSMSAVSATASKDINTALTITNNPKLDITQTNTTNTEQNKALATKALSTDALNLTDQNVALSSQIMSMMNQTPSTLAVSAPKDSVVASDSNTLNTLGTTASSSINATQTMLSNQLAQQLNQTDVDAGNTKLATKDANALSDLSTQKLNIDQKELNNALSSGKNTELSKQLADLQAQVDPKALSNTDAGDKPNTFGNMMNADMSSKLTIGDASNQGSSSLLNKEHSSALSTEALANNATLANSSGSHFAEQLNQTNRNAAVANTLPNNQSTINTPFGGPDWTPALNQRITWMVRDQLQNASITINPPHLGPIEVRLQTDQAQQTSVQFFSNHADVRQAISDSLPTLREMMSQSGLQLGQADVSSGGQSNSQQSSASENRRNNAPELISPTSAATEVSQGVGLINTFA